MKDEQNARIKCKDPQHHITLDNKAFSIIRAAPNVVALTH